MQGENSEEENIIEVKGEHNHVGEASAVEAAKIYGQIRHKAKTTRDAPHSIISTAVIQCSQVGALKLLKIDSMKRTIRKIRQKEMTGPALPNDRRDIVFLDEFCKTFNGDDFLLFDSGAEENRILIFPTRRNLLFLAQSENCYADGTFKTMPLLFQ